MLFKWIRKQKLEKLKSRLFDLEWSFPPKTYSFDESQFLMRGRQIRMDNLKKQISNLEEQSE